MKFLAISACLILGFFIIYVSMGTYKEKASDKIAWIIMDGYAISLIYVAIKLIFGV
ncbi:hypothetical protein [Streptococcus agalactiae]|uniref:hypothetical protein n=1 Tax=Streptococcus agalactiae TaxID=1311 RepID=UPI00159F23E5|nr:hypothetical protein [Streptococcus agalactiae]